MPLLVAVVLVGESLLMFGVPGGESAKYVYVDQGPITYLRTHEGQDRFLDFAVLTPNWGSQFGLNALNAIDLPFPEKFSKLIETQLYPGLDPSNQFVIHNGMTGMIAQENEIVTHFKNYEAASVKYLLMPNALPILPALTNLGVTLVFSDAKANIYEMPNPRPFLSTKSSSCTVTTTNVDAATVSCPNGASTLVRTELVMAGWKAYVNGKSVTIKTVDGVYQSVKVPQGTSTVTYSFLPPHEKYAVLLALLAALFLVGDWIYERRLPLTNASPESGRRERGHHLRRHRAELHDADVRLRIAGPTLRRTLRRWAACSRVSTDSRVAPGPSAWWRPSGA